MKEKVICLPSSDLGYLSRLVCEDIERLRQSLRTGDYFDRRSQERLFKHAMGLYERLGNCDQEIPTINPEDLRPKGRWIEKPYLLGTSRFCSLCGENYGMPHGIYNYCPNCGARMGVEE